MDENDTLAETLRITLKFLDHPVKGLAGVNRIQENPFRLGHFTHQLQLFGLRQGITAADITIDDFDVPLPIKINIMMIVGAFSQILPISRIK